MVACNSGRVRNVYPNGTYSEDVVAPGISQRDLNLKLALYKASSGAEYTYSAVDGQYRIKFIAHGPSNEEREKMYYNISELKKAVYSIQLDDEDELFKNGNCSNEYYYKVAVANPQFKEAIINYAECIEYDSPSEALAILDFVRDEDVAQEMIAEIKNIMVEREARRQAEAEEARIIAAERAQQQRALKQQEYEQQKSTAQNISSWMNAAADVLNATNNALYGNKSNSYTNTNTSTYNSGSTGNTSANCNNYQRRYDNFRSKRDSEQSSSDKMEANAAGKRAAHTYATDANINASRWEVSPSDYRAINNSKKLIRGYEHEMKKVLDEAKKAGCTIRNP